jgi:hypothetical protein
MRDSTHRAFQNVSARGENKELVSVLGPDSNQVRLVSEVDRDAGETSE